MNVMVRMNVRIFPRMGCYTGSGCCVWVCAKLSAASAQPVAGGRGDHLAGGHGECGQPGGRVRYYYALALFVTVSEFITFYYYYYYYYYYYRAFYLDRSPCVKHMAGPFFTEGSFTKNSQREVDEMMEKLQAWSRSETRPTPQELDVERAKLVPLVASTSVTVDLEKFMGSWYVLANIPTFFEQNVGNCIENYLWNAEKKRVDITFTYRAKGSSESSSTSMKGVVINAPLNTHWLVSPRLLGSIFMPIKLDYLIIDFDSVYLPDTGLPSMEYVTVGVPNRSYLWIMTRATPSEFSLDGKGSNVAMEVLNEVAGTEDKAQISQLALERAVLLKAINRATELGYDPKQILRVPWSST